MNEWERLALYADLVGVTEIARHLGVPRSRVCRWIERRESTNCPSPVRVLVCGQLYSLAHWQTWFKLWQLTRSADNWLKKKDDSE